MLRALSEAEPHEFSSPFGTDDPVTGDRGDEPVDGGRVDASGRSRAQDSGIEHLGAGDGHARRPLVDTAADALDLGQLRHRAACPPTEAVCTPAEAACTPTTGSLSASVVRVDGSDGFDGDLRGGGFGGLLRGPVTRTPAVLTQKRGGGEDHRVIGTRGRDLVADGAELE